MSTRAMRRISLIAACVSGAAAPYGVEAARRAASRAATRTAMPVTKEIAKPTRPMITHVVPKPTVLVDHHRDPHREDDAAGRREARFWPTNVAWRAIVARSSGSFARSARIASAVRRSAAADPEDGDGRRGRA